MSASPNSTTKDNWANDSYIENARFVPRLANVLIDDFLVPASTDTILDIGCGDGELTAKINCSYIAGTDSSAALIERTKAHKGPDGNTIKAIVGDGRDLNAENVVKELGRNSQPFDKVVSNAALHWILYTRDRELQYLRKESGTKPDATDFFNQSFDDALEKEAQEYGNKIRQTFFDNVYKSLKPGSVFAAEMGGLGNVSEICSSFIAVLAAHGLSPSQVRNSGIIPWYFPHEKTIQKYLENSGFTVEKIERAYRSTALPHGNLGLKQWTETFGFTFIEAFEKVQDQKEKIAISQGKEYKRVSKDEFLDQVCENIKFSCYDPEDKNSDQSYVNYVRLRWRAVKK